VASLRPSQIETLKLVEQREWHGVGLSVVTLAANLGITERSAERRLLRLVDAGTVEREGSLGHDVCGKYLIWPAYRLTDQGRAVVGEEGR
jgi:predicted transcriptional regulator